MTINVIKHDGTKEEFSWEKIEAFYKRVNHGFNTKCPFSAIKENLKTYIVEDMSTFDINKVIIKSAIDLISVQNIKWQNIAGRMMMRNLYKDWSRANSLAHADKYEGEYFYNLIAHYTKTGLYNEKILALYTKEEIEELAKEMKEEYDMNYIQSTVATYMHRYLLNRVENGIMELPQHMYLANAMFLGCEEKEGRLDYVKKLYKMTTKGEISLPTPTLLNARTSNSQLSSCFILTPADDIRSIFHNYESMAMISKNGGGLGVYMGNIRSKGGSMKGVMGLSGGVMPWAKITNDIAIAVNQMGKRNGSISVTLDVFHRDIFDWLDMQTETGDIRGKAFDLFPAVSFPDIFMRRVDENRQWSLFCPKEVEDVYGKRLQDHFGEEFDTFYEELEQDPRMTLKTTIEAKELFKMFMKSTVETGMPYAFFRDTVNKLNPNKHAGSIYCSNLCTEIAQNQSENTFIAEEDDNGIITTRHQSGDTVICNLASINVAKVNTPEKIAEVVPVAMRTLDNVISLNDYPNKEAEISAQKYRAVGLGMMGVAQYFAENKIMYGSPESVEAADRLFENLAYETMSASVDLAKERGAYPAFEGSEYSKGFLYGKTQDEICHVEEKDKRRHNWFSVTQNMIKYGTRFGYHSSPAPNTSTSRVIGTTAGVVPVYKKYFTEPNKNENTVVTAPNLNAENFWYYPEYINMELSKVINVVATIQKWIDQSVSFEWMIDPNKTSPKEVYDWYFQGWRAGLKTVYYVRSLSKTVDEDDCASCSG